MPSPTFSRFRITTLTSVLRPNTPIDFYRQGATATATTTVPGNSSSTPISVRNTGDLVVNDVVIVGPDGNQLTIDGILGPAQVSVTNNSASPVTVPAATRLIPTEARPSIYADHDTQAETTSSISSDANAHALGYIDAGRFDYVVAPTGDPKQVFAGAAAGDFQSEFRGGPALNVKDFPSVAVAIAATPAGGRLYFPPDGGPYIPPSASGWTIDKPIEIFSDNGGDESTGFQYFNSQGRQHKNSTILTISAGVNRVHIHDVVFSSGLGPPDDNDGVGDAIRVMTDTTATQLLRIEGVTIFSAGRSAIRAEGPNYLLMATFSSVVTRNCKGHGIYIKTANFLEMANVESNGHRLSGTYLERCGQSSIHIDCTGNGIGLMSAELEGQLVLKDCADVTIHNSNFEHFTSNTSTGDPLAVKNAIVLLGSRGCVIGGNEFDNARIQANFGSRSIYLRDGSYGNTILSNLHADVDRMVEIDSGSADVGNIVNPQACQGGDANGPGKVTLPSGGRNFCMYTNLSDGSNDKKGVGILLPSMPNVANVDASVTQDGLLVFDSNDGKLKIRTGGTWGVANQDPSLRILAKTADQSQGAFAGVDIADLTVPLAANEVIHFHAHLIASASATSIGIQLAINGPASPVEVDATILGWTTGAASLMTGVNAFESYQTNSTSAGAMRRVFEIKGRVICGGTAGTFALRFKPDQVPGSVKIHRGSWLQYFMGAN